MSLLSIITYPDPFLSKQATKVAHFDAALKTLCEDMLQTMYTQNGCGLAATQVARLEHVFVLDVSPAQDQPLCLINTKIIAQEDEQILSEGCLSFPGIYARVKRAGRIEIAYQTPEGLEQRLIAEGLLAVCLQHELDHLNGVVFVDHLSRFKRNWVLRKFKTN